ncbi:hypothetical protein A0H81_14874 [Grifola frondosa]|uniref:Uncharacterized protein n=1 Tax=Grifola frondosa TaxID=5627 RepID=A0A1C7LLS3_GRIFR|nr:hypothetical protein A0H81_14874 [Grifola frondosa]
MQILDRRWVEKCVAEMDDHPETMKHAIPPRSPLNATSSNPCPDRHSCTIAAGATILTFQVIGRDVRTRTVGVHIRIPPQLSPTAKLIPHAILSFFCISTICVHSHAFHLGDVPAFFPHLIIMFLITHNPHIEPDGLLTAPVSLHTHLTKLLILYYADGCTESSALALSMLMSLRTLSLPEAYLTLQASTAHPTRTRSESEADVLGYVPGFSTGRPRAQTMPPQRGSTPGDHQVWFNDPGVIRAGCSHSYTWAISEYAAVVQPPPMGDEACKERAVDDSEHLRQVLARSLTRRCIPNCALAAAVCADPAEYAAVVQPPPMGDEACKERAVDDSEHLRQVLARSLN